MRSFITLLFVFIAASMQAQRIDSLPHYLRLSATGNLNRSNSSTAYLLDNDVSFSSKNSRRKLNADAGWTYGEQGSSLTNNDFTATGDFNLFPDSSRLYYWALGNFTSSYSLKIIGQAQAGLGLAYNFVDTKKAWFNLSDGIIYEGSRLNQGDTATVEYRTARNSLRLSYLFKMGAALTLRGSNFWQQALGNAPDYILRLNNSLGLKLNKWMTLTASLSYNQYTRTGAENFLFTYGIVAEKSF